MKIYMVRHFATPGNLKKRYIGTTDESIVILENIREMPPVQKLYVSPMRRCRETASLLYPEMKQNEVEGFRECDFGKFENKNYRELDGNAAYQRWIDSGGKDAFPGGEHPEDFRRRSREGFEACLDELISEGIQEAAMIVHGGTIMAVLAAYGRPEKDFYEWHVENGCGFCVNVNCDLWKNKKKELHPEYRIERNDR